MTDNYGPRQSRMSHDVDRPNEPTYDTLSSATTYRSAVSPRVTNVQRSRPTGLGVTSSSTKIFQNYSSSGNTGFGPGLASLANLTGVPMRGGPLGTYTGVATITLSRKRDKHDLELLNDKFAQYVEKVRFLEAQNRKLNMELEALRSRAGQGSSRIKEMYDIERDEAENLIDDTKHEVATARAKAEKLEQEVKRQAARVKDITGSTEAERREIDNLQRKIAENEAQIALLRRRIADLEDESRRYKLESQRLSSEISRLQNEIQNELFIKASCEVEKVALEDEIETLKQIHEAELAELRSQSVSNDLDPSQFFRNELSQAIQEVRNDYENNIDNRRNELQNQYHLLVKQTVIHNQPTDSVVNIQQVKQSERLRTDILQKQNQNAHLEAKNKEMRNRLDELRRKIKETQDQAAHDRAKGERDIDEARRNLERAKAQYDQIIEFKTSLEKEIDAYRKQLEGPDGLQGCVDRIVQNAEQKALERPVGPIYSKSIRSTTSIRHTFINSSGSNYAQGNPTPGATISNLATQSPPTGGAYQTASSTHRDVIYRNQPNNNNASRNSTSHYEISYDDSFREPPHEYTNLTNVYRNTTQRESVRARQSADYETIPEHLE
ncbi:unnamed protein product [Adineta ricciae]|uniref:IF rod domain-containing protein n=1 Tax=Adineta ricciae TaxID=249248 RepID=A0A815PMN7_ADIRI|nr:unnamed protein product [Adineta ricciae]